MEANPKKRTGKPPAISTLQRKKMILFGWYGGKFSHLDWLLPLLPKCHHYCEPFAGSAAVLLNRIQSHNAADVQTGASGDIEICLMNDDKVVTVYEMKKKPVIHNDIDHAVTKIFSSQSKIDYYIIITTETISDEVSEHARSMYFSTDGTEVVILDYLGFIRHYLHFFHRYRGEFLDAYQELVLAEPASAVPQSLKEAFLALRSSLQSEEEAVD